MSDVEQNKPGLHAATNWWDSDARAESRKEADEKFGATVSFLLHCFAITMFRQATATMDATLATVPHASTVTRLISIRS